MSDENRSLEERLEALEEAVSNLQEQFRSLQIGAMRGGRRPRPAPKSRKPPTTRSLPKIDVAAEDLLRWAGIGLVVIAVGLLFKYAVDAGWLTPAVRIVIGFGIGLFLTALGFRIHQNRPRFGQVLQGGGIAAFYITLFAAFQVLELIPYLAAFVGMASVTAVALTLGLWQNDAGLAVFGLLGGLATPFLLYTGEGDIAALISYACLLLTATTAIYLWKGWQSTLYVTVVGGWTVFFIAAIQLLDVYSPSFGDRLAVQLSGVFAMLVFWAAPVVRTVVRPAVDSGDVSGEGDSVGRTGVLARLEWSFRNVVQFLIVSTPLLSLLITNLAWNLSDVVTGITAMGLAGLFAAAGAHLAGIDDDVLSHTHFLAAGLLMTVGIMLVLDGDTLFVTLAGEAAILHVLARRLDDKWARAAGHTLFFGIAWWMYFRLQMLDSGPPALFNAAAASDILVMAFTLVASYAMATKGAQNLYRAGAYVALLGWLARELSVFENGQALVTVSWAVCGVVLLVSGMRRDNNSFRRAGLATLALVVGKLFVVDLAMLDPIWRILLFMVVGAGFLVLGYFVPTLWRPTGEKTQD